MRVDVVLGAHGSELGVTATRAFFGDDIWHRDEWLKSGRLARPDHGDSRAV